MIGAYQRIVESGKCGGYGEFLMTERKAYRQYYDEEGNLQEIEVD